MARAELSTRQAAIFEFLKSYITEKHYPPSIRDIQEGCGVSSTSVVDYNLKRLEQRGLIHRDRDISRGIELLGEHALERTAPLTVPLLGKIAAGAPLPTFPDSPTADVERIEVTRDQTRGRTNAFALRVEGTSMVEDLINDGDIVILEPVSTCDDGEQVAVWLKDAGETTLKRLYREGAQVRLQPANAAMDPIRVDANDVEIQGRVLSTLRLTPA